MLSHPYNEGTQAAGKTRERGALPEEQHADAHARAGHLPDGYPLAYLVFACCSMATRWSFLGRPMRAAAPRAIYL